MRQLALPVGDLARMVAELRRIPREARTHAPRPPRDGLVIEVGSGQRPHPASTVVVDKYVTDSFEREQERPLSFRKPLVVGDGEALPFADDAAQYAIALHVLEHAPDPARFAAELSRVAAAGFVQVPTREAELTFGWLYHPWLIDRRGDVLVFAPKDGRSAPCGTFFHESFQRSPLLRLWWAANRSAWHHSVDWAGELQVEVDGDAQKIGAEVDLERTRASLADAHTRGLLLPLPPAAAEALRCPACRGRVEEGAGRLSCVACERSYELVGPVPVLLASAAEGSSTRRARAAHW